ncbi:MAG: choice-of-anchor P family protein [Nocardioides sp.]
MNTCTAPGRRGIRRLVALAATTALTTALVAVAGAPAAQAAGRPTDFAFTSFAYGTKVKAANGELRSGRTAPSWIGCTRQAGKTKANELLAVDAPSNNPLIHIGAVTSSSHTYKQKKQGIAAGTQSTSTVANVVLGLQNPQLPTPVLTITGLKVTATAWATTDGQLHASTDSGLLDINLVVPPTGTPLDQPLQQLLALVNGTVAPTLDQVVALLQQNNGGIEIPGLGKLELGYSHTGIGTRQAAAVALSLRVTLYGLDQLPGTADDSSLKIGRSYAKIIGNMPYAVMGGSGWAADADLVGGTAHIGDIVPKQLPCQGTDGQIRTKALAAVDIPGVTLGALQGRAYGRISQIGRVRAWTEGSVAHVSLGSGDTTLTIDGIVGRVNLVTDRRGRLVKRDTEGTIPGVLTFQGQSYTLPLGSAPELPPELSALISIQTGVTDQSDARGLRVTALRITLLGGTAAGTVVDLGNAKASIRES